MCGINGFNWNDPALVQKMNEVVRYRGPDDTGYHAGAVTLGHARLSIIDLSPRGHQPMANEDETVWITFNGEIYNYRELRDDLTARGHRFRSETDTEVIIHAYEEYGPACMEQFNGMWAFCIYDMKAGRLILSRDRYGIKPLYFYTDERRIIFSSMIGGILCHEIETSPNDAAIMDYLAYNLEDHTEKTFFTGIRRLMPGSALTYDLGTGTADIEVWYTPVDKENSIKDDIHTLFFESVRRHTVADVPIGSCLSGGVDSSSIVLMLDRILPDEFQTFSLIAPGSPRDESPYIAEVGKHTRTRQFYTTVDPVHFLEDIEDFIRAQEEPVTEVSTYAQYRVMKLAHDHGAKVLLDGQGGDELFAGYVYYYAFYFRELFTRFRWITLAREMAQFFIRTESFYPYGLFLYLLFPGSMRRFLFRVFMNRWIDYRYMKQADGVPADPRLRARTLDECLSMTLFSTAIPHLLRFEDKNSMRWGVESRVPFLDVELVEAALSLPAESKLDHGETKVVFKRAMRSILPALIAGRTDKIGFEIATDDFFRNPDIAAFCERIIMSESFRNRPYWRWKRVKKIFRAHLRGTKNAGKSIWKWINTELWLRMYCE